MSENGLIMDRPRRTTRSSLASSTAASASSPSTPAASSNPYKKPTYSSSSRGGGSGAETPSSNGTPRSSRGRGGRGRGRPPGRPSFSRGSTQSHHHHHTKPECIAVRVDGRRSTGGSTASSGGGRRGAGGRRSTYNSRVDYEYHYGSDFESDHDSEEPEEEDIESEQEESDADSVASLPGRNDDAESDSDFSVSSRVTSTSRLPSPPVPIWLDTEKVPEIPQLELPSSSDDLLLSREHVVKAVEIYEPLRRFHQLVRLSPFRFEDFCAALAHEDQSALLAEIHIQLLKSVIREEDANGTLFGPNEVKDSVQAVVYFIDHITWPESLRSYLESDPAWAEVHEALISVEYPFCEPSVRIKVLGLLVDQFLTTNAVREQLLGEGNIMHEDHCRACNRLGELICCEQCPAVYHLECITPPLKDPDNPPDDWKCSVCMKHQIPGVNDCTSEVEKMGLLIRHERLGFDRHGRKYWFLVRRILVESEDGSEVWYYSTRKQVGDLLDQLDADNYESSLVTSIKSIEDEMYRQMEVTEEVTRQQNTHRRKTYLDVESGKENEGMEGPERMTRLKSSGLYKLGQEGLFKTYTNHFVSDPAALPKGKQNEERDRKRHMSHKFSLTTASECKYGIKDLIGCPRSVQVNALKNALTHMEAVLPTTLMHVNWPMLRKSWLQSVQGGYYPADFSQAMIMISSCIRNAVYNPVWSESTGHVRFSRMSLLEREEKKKAEKRDKKDKDDEEDRLKSEPQFVKYTLPIRHQVYKQKGEEYRLHGRWGWIWLSNMRRCKSQDCREVGLLAGPHKHVIQVKNETGKVKTMLIDPSVYSKLMAKRSLATTNSNSTVNANTTSSPPKSPPHGTGSSEELSPAEKDTDSSSSNNETVQSTTNEENDTEVKEEKDEKTEEKDKEEDEKIADNDTHDVVVIKEEERFEKSSKSTTEENNDDQSEVTDEKEKEGEVKTEPMEVEELDKEKEVEKESSPNAEVENVENGHVEEMQATDEVIKDKETEEQKEVEKPSEENQQNEGMEVDEKPPTPPVTKIGTTVESEEAEKEVKSTEDVSDNKPLVNGTDEPELMEESSSEAEKENKNSSPEEAPTVPSSASASPSHDEKDKESEPLTQAPVSAETPQPSQTNVNSTPASEKSSAGEDSQGRKFRTELVNVSSGLTSTHRILYPKVAKRCEYLDSLLQRKLTLRSLEEKTLRSEFGEEMVLKAKKGIADFEEEEKRRAQEAEEYPTEEVLDPNLTLGGAYAFCCYSTECRKEALLFLKTKGKNRERLYEKVCYSPMCRLKFCLQETIRLKQEKAREFERVKHYNVYKEIEAKRVYTNEETSQKVYMKKLPDCVLAVINGAPATGTGTPIKNELKKKKTPSVKYPQVSSFQYSISKKPSILVLPPYELTKLARTAGRMFTPSGFFPNPKSGTWGWSLPCGRPVFRTAWQYKTTHARTLGAAALQLRVLYASIKWDDIVAKIPNTEGKNQVHTDTEIITTEILNHRIVGRFMERVQYLRKMMIVPIDAPKKIREVTPSRIGLRKRKRAESPDKSEPVVTEDWVDEERLELWEIRYYGDRIDRRTGDRLSSGGATPSASTRTKSGVAIKQPEKYDPSFNPSPSGEKKSYPAHPHKDSQNALALPSPGTSAGAAAIANSMADTLGKTIDHVIRSANRTDDGGNPKPVSAVNAAELMRETIAATELKMQRTVHVSKRDKHNNVNGNKLAPPPVSQPTASQQFQQLQQNNSKGISSGSQPQQRNIAQVVGGPTVPGAKTVIGKKFFQNRQATAISNNISGLDTGILTKRPMQNTITINKGAAANISFGKNPALQNPIQSQQMNAVNNGPQQQMQAQQPQTGQKLSLIKVNGRNAVRGLLPGQHCFQMSDGKINLTVNPMTPQQLQSIRANIQSLGGTELYDEPTTMAMPPLEANTTAPPTTSIAVISSPSSVAPTSISMSQAQIPQQMSMTANTIVSVSASVPIQQQQQIIVSSQPQQQQPIINISSQAMKSSISSSSTPVTLAQNANNPLAQQQVILQQHGQHFIIQGPGAQAFLQQQKLLQQQRSTIQGPVIVASSGSVSGSPTVVTSSQVASAAASGGRFLLAQQGGKTVVINQAAPGTVVTSQSPQQRNVILNKQVIQTSASTASGSQQTVVRSPQVMQSGQTQGVQLIQSGQQVHIVQQGTSQLNPSGQQQQQFVVQQQQAPPAQSEPSKIGTVSTPSTPTASSSGGTTVICSNPSSVASPVTASTPTSSGVVATPSSPLKVLSSSSTTGTPTAAAASTTASTSSVVTPVRHVLPDGRTLLLTPNQLSNLSSMGGKIVVNKQVVQLPTSGTTTAQSSGIRPQILQTLASGQQHQIQIVKGPGGQQFLIQQPIGTQTVLQQQGAQQQQQVQLVMQAGPGGQPVLVKKIVKTAGSPATAQLGKTGNIVQIPTSAQNQLAQLIGPNKALIRLDNNQLAAIPLPVQQQQQQTTSPVGGTETISSATTSATSPSTPVIQSVKGSTPATQQLQPATPTSSTAQQQQQQATITRPPGLPISIVSPSKTKAQQGNSPQKSPVVQGGTTSNSPVSVTSPVPVISGTTSLAKTPTVVRVASPTIIRGASASLSPSSAALRSPAPVVMSSSPTTRPVTPQQRLPQSPVKTPVFATKSAPPQLTPQTQTPTTPQAQPQISSLTSSPVVQQQTGVSNAASPSPSVSSSPLVTATKSFPSSLSNDEGLSVGSSPAANANTDQGTIPAVAPTPNPAALPSPSTGTTTPGSNSGVPTTTPAKTKLSLNKIVAQIFQTPQGPKVVIQGVSPGDLTQAQMMQLQQQIHRQLQQQQQTTITNQVQKTPPASPSTSAQQIESNPPVTPSSSATAGVGAGAQPQAAAISTVQQNSLTTTQSPVLSHSQTLSNAQHNSPVETLRSVPATVSHAPSPLTSPVFSRSPAQSAMVSPAKILSPPSSHTPNMLSASRTISASFLNRAPPEPSTPGITSPPVVVARKSAPRKSPIKTNNLDSPPQILSPPPPPILPPPPPVVHHHHHQQLNSRGMNSVAAELMQPLNSEQQQILDEARDVLKGEIMDKKKAAATQMKLAAQKEIQETRERAKANELAKAKANAVAPAPAPPAPPSPLTKKANVVNTNAVAVTNHQNRNNASAINSDSSNSSGGTAGGVGGRGGGHCRGKKRKMKTNSRNSTDGGNAGSNNRRGSGATKRKRKLFCICETPYDKDKFYVGCDKCDNWFHGDCVGITEEMSKDLQEYICDDCKDDKLYCLCQKPYNDAQFYIQCDKCDDWFHGRCVGVLQGESESIGDYCCPSCEPNSDINAPNSKHLETADFVALGRLLKEVHSNRSSIPFRRPVKKTEVPNYYDVIKDPMDLATMSTRLEERKYERLVDFIGDMVKIFENCRYFNDQGTDIYRHADNLEKFLVQKIWTLRQSFNTKARQGIR